MMPQFDRKGVQLTHEEYQELWHDAEQYRAGQRNEDRRKHLIYVGYLTGTFISVPNSDPAILDATEAAYRELFGARILERVG